MPLGKARSAFISLQVLPSGCYSAEQMGRAACLMAVLSPSINVTRCSTYAKPSAEGWAIDTYANRLVSTCLKKQALCAAVTTTPPNWQVKRATNNGTLKWSREKWHGQSCSFSFSNLAMPISPPGDCDTRFGAAKWALDSAFLISSQGMRLLLTRGARELEKALWFPHSGHILV